MALTTTQQHLLQVLVADARARNARQFVCRTEWTGWLPYPVSSWIECGEKGINNAGLTYTSSDVAALAQAGHVRLVHAWQNPQDEYEERTTYELIDRPGSPSERLRTLVAHLRLPRRRR